MHPLTIIFYLNIIALKALLIIDIQNDFLPGGALPVKEGDQIIDKINEIQMQYDVVVATQDWHPIHHKSFVTQHPGKNTYDEIMLEGVTQTLWPPHCVQDSWGARFPDTLSLKNVSAIFRKGMNPLIDSYSGFFDNTQNANTGLDSFLKGKGVNAVDICGLAADYCVYFTALDALQLGYQSTILLDLTKAIDNIGFEEKKVSFVERGGILLQ